jgi:hypothetical protein
LLKWQASAPFIFKQRARAGLHVECCWSFECHSSCTSHAPDRWELSKLTRVDHPWSGLSADDGRVRWVFKPVAVPQPVDQVPTKIGHVAGDTLPSNQQWPRLPVQSVPVSPTCSAAAGVVRTRAATRAGLRHRPSKPRPLVRCGNARTDASVPADRWIRAQPPVGKGPEAAGLLPLAAAGERRPR